MAKTYINSVFTKRQKGQYGEFFKMGIKKEEFIKELQALQEDERGWVNLVLTDRANDPVKMSLYVDNFVPDATKAAATTNASSVVNSTVSANDDSGLPF